MDNIDEVEENKKLEYKIFGLENIVLKIRE